MTGSRGTFLSLLAVVIFAWLISKNKMRNFTILAIVGTTLIIGANFLFQKGFWSEYTQSRITSTFLVTAPQGGESRLNIYIVGLQMVKDNPILGVGLGNFPVRFEDYISQVSSSLRNWHGVEPGRDPHNVYLSVQAELGIIGTILFLAFFRSIFRNLWVYRNRPEGFIGLVLFIFIVVAGSTVTIQYNKYFWLVLSLATTIPLICKNEQEN
jgi:O-antigen ligase